jgi:regulator of sigma E protease
MPVQFAIWIFLSLFFYLVLVLIHMLSHLLAARALNIRMEAAFFGIGPRLFKLWRTKLVMRIPIIHCEELIFEQPPKGPSEKTGPTPSKLGSFWRKTVVLAAGPLVSFLLAAGILAWLSSAGTPVYLPIIGQVRAGSPAEKAGLIAGDKIISVDKTSVVSWSEMADMIADSSGAPVQLQIERGTTLLAVTVLPEIQIVTNVLGEQEKRPMIGIAWSGAIEMRKPPLWQLPVAGIVQASNLIRYNVAYLSAWMAFLTLLPLPIFDGGQFLYLVFESLSGKQISPRLKRRFRLLSIFLLLAFAAVVFLLNIVDLLSP